MTKSNQPNTYPFLDGFRAIALLMILIHHMCVGFNLYNLFDTQAPILYWIFIKAWTVFHIDLSLIYVGLEEIILKFKGILGVQIFLIISGFLISRGLLKRTLQWNSIGRFYLRRFLRIYPIYFLMIVISLCLFAYETRFEFKEILGLGLRYALFLQNYFPRNFYLEHTWTLVIFEQFYFFTPLVILLVSRIFVPLKARQISLSLCCLALLCLGALIKFRYLTYGRPLLSWPLQAPAPYFTTLYHLGSFVAGCLVAIWEPQWSKWRKNRWIGFICWVIGAGIYYYLLFVLDWGYGWGRWYLNILGYLATISLMLAAYHGVSILARFQFMQWIGRYSYGTYIWHILVLVAWARGLGHIAPTLLVIGYLISALIVGFISGLTIEKFFMNIRKKILF